MLNLIFNPIDTEVQFNPERTINSYGVRKLHNYWDFLIDFFEFYRDFDFDHRFISVFDGEWQDSYFVQNNPQMQRPMKVSGIFQNNINAAKIVTYNQRENFQGSCMDAANILYENDY